MIVADGRYTLWSTTQNPHLVRQWLSRDTLRAPEHAIRVVAPDVGGGFGQKTYHYPEEASLPWAARLVGRPVRWTATRAETLAVDIHARDHVTEARMAFDADGRIAAVEANIIANLGAYQSQFAACIPTLFLRHHVLRPVRDSPRCTAGCSAPTPTPRRSTPIAAPAIPRSPTSSSA